MLRVIQEARPAWIVGENVAGIINVALEQVCADLEAEGYEVQPLVIPASAVNAPHQRKRVWIIANSKRRGCGENGKSGSMETIRRGRKDDPMSPKESNPHASDTDNIGGVRGDTNKATQGGKVGPQEYQGNACDARDASCVRLERESRRGTGQEFEDGFMGNKQGDWDIPWLEVATRFCRVDDGLPAWVYRHRVKRLKALGNAIVPAVAFEILRGIAEIESKYYGK